MQSPDDPDSIESIYISVIAQYPQLRKGMLASGYPARLDNDPKRSDVDIALMDDPNLDWVSILGPHAQVYTIASTHTIIRISGYNRDVNVFITLDSYLYMRGPTNRMHHLTWARARPDLIPNIQLWKRSGMSTNDAWNREMNGDANPQVPAHFQAALNVLLREISNEPTRLNTLSHDVLRKIILYVGDLPRKHDMIVNGQRMLICEVEKALNSHTCKDSILYSDIKMSKCSYCDLVYIWSGRTEDSDVCYCSCYPKCKNTLCNTMDVRMCPGAEEYACTECNTPDGVCTKHSN